MVSFCAVVVTQSEDIIFIKVKLKLFRRVTAWIFISYICTALAAQWCAGVLYILMCNSTILDAVATYHTIASSPAAEWPAVPFAGDIVARYVAFVGR